MYKCKDCGDLVEELREVEPTINDSGYTEDTCSCGGQYETAYKCKECGEWFTEDELNNGICQKCIDGFINLENIVKYVKRYDLHNDIYKFLKEFVEQDQDHFAEFCIKEL